MKHQYLMEIKPTIPSDLVSVPDAEQISGMTRRTLWRKIRCDELRAWGHRRCYRVSVSELLAPVVVRSESRG